LKRTTQQLKVNWGGGCGLYIYYYYYCCPSQIHMYEDF
jgi:hypothetical protein